MLRELRHSLVIKVGLAAAALALSVAVGGAAMSYTVFRDQMEQAVRKEMAAYSTNVTTRIAAKLQELSDSLSQLARNTVFANALADSEGRANYLRPFLSGLQQASGIPVRVVLSDYLGRTLESNSPDALPKVGDERLKSVVDSGVPQMFVEHDGPDTAIVTMSFPVLYANTGLPEGAVTYQFNLKSLAKPFLSKEYSFRILWENSSQKEARPFIHGDAPSNTGITCTSTLALPGVFKHWHAVLQVSDDDNQLREHLRNLAFKHMLLGVLGLLFIVPVSLLGARRIMARLKSLESVAFDVVNTRSFHAVFPERGSDEIARLGHAFNRMLDELRDVNEALEEDIAGRKRTEDALAERELLYRTVFEGAREAIIVIDLEGEGTGRIVSANPVAAKIHGYSLDEFIGLGLEDLEVSASSTELQTRVETVLSGQVLRGVINHRRKDGSVFPLEVLANLVEIRGHKYSIGIDRDISERKMAEDALRDSEARVRAKLESILSPEGDIGNLELPDVLDIRAIQTLMDNLYGITNITQALLDTSGKILAAAGWQDICTKFHRVHPETGMHCLESDTQLSAGIKEGSFRLYRCKNNMWDAATPIIIGGKHLGNLFLGQFLFDDETPDYELFTSQALRNGFDEQEYLAALDRVPRFSKDLVQNIMVFYAQLATLLSTLSYSNIKLAKSLTEQERLFNSLRESEARFRTVFQTSPDAVILNRLTDGTFVDTNDRFTELTGLSSEEVLGVPSVNTNLWVDPRDRQRILDEIARNGKVYNFEARFRMRDGRVKTGLFSATITTINEEPHLLSIIRDIEDRKQAEEERLRLATAVEQSAETVVITDAEGSILYVNPAFERTTGYSREEAIGSNPRILKSGHHDDEFYKRMWNAISEGISWRGRLVTKKKDGTVFEEDASISPVTDDFGKIVNYVAVKRDISGEASLQRQLSQAQKMEAIGTLAGGIAHDFNNVLQVALGFSEIMLDDEDFPEQYQADLRKIHESSKRGADLVQRLLTFSRKTEINLQALNLNVRILELLKMLERTLPKMLDIKILQDAKLAAINADQTQIDQILMNLAVNARDAMPEGGKLLFETSNVTLDEEYVQAHLDAKMGPHVLLTVTDTGLGMDKDTLEHIFEPFYTTKGVGEGTGLGLAMVHGIVKHHGGHIRCYSEPGKGTTFKIYFPALISEAEEAQTLQEPKEPGGSETILLVDDEEFIRDLGSRILEKAGYTVITAANGKEALDVYEQRSGEIDLVLLDLMMPEMGGKQCLEGLLSLNPAVNVIIASGYAARGPTKEALEAGAKGFVNKPYDMRQVREVVRQVLDAE